MEQTHEKPATDHVLQTPLWVMIIRGLQFLFSLIVLGLCARLVHDASLPEELFCIAVAVITWVVIAYAVLTEKISGFRTAYHIIAVICLDGLMVILWLAAWAATAARRAKYVVPVNTYGCYDDGSLSDSKTCNIFKRDGENVILFKSGLAMLAAAAGVGALVWLLFIATFVWTLVMFVRGRKDGRFPVDTSALTTPSNNYQMENKVSEAQPMTQPQPQQGQAVPQYQQQPAPGQFDPQQQQQYPPQSAPSPYQPAQSPYQQQGAYPPPQAAPYSPQDQQFQGQQNYGQYPPQQQYQQPPQTYGSELSGSTPPPPATSPPPHQPYPPQAYPQQ
ncbi:hypothetical protein DER45DRAFT_565753 [Fusarium avenaceum]|nr:hypothetical protein DER45DRAFT_565753 [Fusarium avenaceum]